MLKRIIEKALLLKCVSKEKEVVIEISSTTVFTLHLFKMMVLLLYNFFLLNKNEEPKVMEFITRNYNRIIDIIVTEIKIALHNFVLLNDENLNEEIELHNKDETFLVLAIQNDINVKLKEIWKGEQNEQS